jgi:hypothetical protein
MAKTNSRLIAPDAHERYCDRQFLLTANCLAKMTKNSLEEQRPGIIEAFFVLHYGWRCWGFLRAFRSLSHSGNHAVLSKGFASWAKRHLQSKLDVFCRFHRKRRMFLAQCGFEPEPLENMNVPDSLLGEGCKKFFIINLLAVWLPGMDSNHDSRLQRPLSYH